MSLEYTRLYFFTAAQTTQVARPMLFKSDTITWDNLGSNKEIVSMI